jgi:hypothetical protein
MTNFKGAAILAAIAFLSFANSAKAEGRQPSKMPKPDYSGFVSYADPHLEAVYGIASQPQRNFRVSARPEGDGQPGTP